MVLRIDPARHISQADEPDPDSEGVGRLDNTLVTAEDKSPSGGE
jgi:hypothetical protein